MNTLAERKREGIVSRSTQETDITVAWVLNGEGKSELDTGIGFLDHMLDNFARHGLFDLKVICQGDLEVDGHHTVEDLGICLGKALKRAINKGEGLVRYGSAFIPMDEALVHVVLDISGRGYLAANFELNQARVGQLESCLVEEFFRAFALNSGITLHIRQLSGYNVHHIIEATFKAFAHALRQALAIDKRIKGVLSTKGDLDL